MTTPETGDALIASIDTLFTQIREFEFPRLTVETVTDDGETFTAIRCPRCGHLVDEGELVAVDFTERWNKCSDIASEDAIISRTVQFWWDERGDADETLYYKHKGHAVALPEGWTEQ